MLFRHALRLAVVARRFAWLKDGYRLAEYAPGARGRLQALGFTRDDQGALLGPLVLTVKGTTSRALSQALKAHRAEVRQLT